MKTPFTKEQFFHVFELYNSAVFPFQLILILLGILGLYLLHSKLLVKNKFIGSYLGVLWIWAGIVYHIIFFAEINPAALIFGSIFLLQGLLILFHTSKDRLLFSVILKPRYYIGYFFILFGLIIYPIIGYCVENSIHRTISLGLPCPTTILTFGFFLLTTDKFPNYLLIIPSLWAIVGVSAAINFGVYQDFMILISAIIAVFILIQRKKIKAKASNIG